MQSGGGAFNKSALPLSPGAGENDSLKKKGQTLDVGRRGDAAPNLMTRESSHQFPARAAPDAPIACVASEKTRRRDGHHGR